MCQNTISFFHSRQLHYATIFEVLTKWKDSGKFLFLGRRERKKCQFEINLSPRFTQKSSLSYMEGGYNILTGSISGFFKKEKATVLLWSWHLLPVLRRITYDSFLLQLLRHPRIYVECMGYLKLSLQLIAQAFLKGNPDEDHYNCCVLPSIKLWSIILCAYRTLQIKIQKNFKFNKERRKEISYFILMLY